MKIEKTKSKKAKLVDRLTESDIMKNLHYTDSIAMFQRLGEKSIGGKLYKTLIYTDIIFGSKYTIKTCKRLVTDPKSYNFIFPARLGKMYAIKYFKKMLDFTEDNNYLFAIESYQSDPDIHIRSLAEQTLEKLKNNTETKQGKLKMSKIKVNSIVDLIKNSTKMQKT